jgi:hypothetical protein
MNHVPGNAGPDGWYDEEQPTRRRAGYVAWALISVAVVAAVGFALVWNAWPLRQNTADLHSPAPRAEGTVSLHPAAPLPQQNTAGFHTTAQSPSADAEQVTAAFLQAWSSGAIGAAASLTDDPAAARAALTSYDQDLYLRQLTGTVVSSTAAGTPRSPGGTQATSLEAVTFSLRATVAASAAARAPPATWSYQSVLTAYQVAGGTGWLIEWGPSVVAPNLADGQHLATIVVPPAGTSVTDGAGNPLSPYGDPGLANIGNLLAGHVPTVAGTPGLSVQIEDSANQGRNPV